MVGTHRGHHEFTVGQRRGLGVASSEPLYVLATDAEAQHGHGGARRAALQPSGVRLRGARLHRDASRVDSVRLRYHSRAHGCRVESVSPGGEALLELETPARGVAPGQVACLMDGELIVGLGTIA